MHYVTLCYINIDYKPVITFKSHQTNYNTQQMLKWHFICFFIGWMFIPRATCDVPGSACLQSKSWLWGNFAGRSISIRSNIWVPIIVLMITICMLCPNVQFDTPKIWMYRLLCSDAFTACTIELWTFLYLSRQDPHCGVWQNGNVHTVSVDHYKTVQWASMHKYCFFAIFNSYARQIIGIPTGLGRPLINSYCFDSHAIGVKSQWFRFIFVRADVFGLKVWVW